MCKELEKKESIALEVLFHYHAVRFDPTPADSALEVKKCQDAVFDKMLLRK